MKRVIPQEFDPCTFETPSFPIFASRWQESDRPAVTIHAHDVLELGYCESGTGAFLIDERVLPYGAGCCSVIAPNAFHRAQCTEGEENWWVHMFLDPARLVRDVSVPPKLLHVDGLRGPNFPSIVSPAEYPELCSLVRVLASEVLARRSAREASIRSLVAAIMIQLHRLPGCSRKSETSRTDAAKRIAPALKILAGLAGEEIDVAHLAEVCHMSSSSFRRNFARVMNEPPKHYQIRLRIHSAAAMLQNDDRTVLDVALSSGFATLSSFNRHFRSLMKTSPTEWRRRK